MKKAETSGERIRRLRGDRTQAELARDLGVKRAAVSAWEKDDKLRRPSSRVFTKLASMAPDPGDARWFLAAADVREQEIFAIAEKIRRGASVTASEGDLVRVNALPGTPDVGELLRHKSEVPNPDFAFYFLADEESSRFILAPGVALLDTKSGGRRIPPFWGQIVLTKIPPGRLREYPGQKQPQYMIGKVWHIWSEVALSGFAKLAGAEEPRSHEGIYLAGYTHPEWKDEAFRKRVHQDPNFEDEAIMASHERARIEMETDRGIEIVGSVTGWWPALLDVSRP